jgi:hypothetical protein
MHLTNIVTGKGKFMLVLKSKRKKGTVTRALLFWLIPSPRYLPKNRNAYWIGPYVVMVWQLAIVSGAVNDVVGLVTGAGMAVFMERTTASAVEQ